MMIKEKAWQFLYRNDCLSETLTWEQKMAMADGVVHAWQGRTLDQVSSASAAGYDKFFQYGFWTAIDQPDNHLA